MRRLLELDAQCASSLALTPPNTLLSNENVRGSIVLMSAHFQGFCRDRYTECSQIIASKVRVTLQVLNQAQFTAYRALDHGNPNLHNLTRDFKRLGCNLDLVGVDPANQRRLQHLSDLNQWRNIAAHQGVVPVGGLPDLSDLRTWRNSCDDLAASLDGVMYNPLRKMLKRAPWGS